MSNVDEVLEQLLDTDPKAAARWATRTRYLGDFPADSYAEAFLDAARRQLEPGWTGPAPSVTDTVAPNSSPRSPTA